MTKRVTVELSRDGLSQGYQVSINAYEGDGPSGHGYRIFGPKFNGTSTLIKSETLNERDANEIRAYCDLVTEPANVRPGRRASEPGDELYIEADGQSMTFRQVGWHGQTGAFYSLDEDPSLTEPGSFGPLWILAHNDALVTDGGDD